MSYSLPFVYFTMGGHFGAIAGDGVEKWQVGFKIPMGLAPPAPSELAQFLQDVEDEAVAFHTNAAVAAGNVCILTRLTAAHVGTDGKYTGGGEQATTVRDLVTRAAGAGVATMPFQVSCVYSLRTSILRGPASHGRFYYPCLAGGWDGLTGQWNLSQTQGRASAGATLIQAIGDEASTPLDTSIGVAVMSEVGNGRTARVEKVLVGRTPDTQRRRVRDIVEDYQSATVPGALAVIAERDSRPIGSTTRGV